VGLLADQDDGLVAVHRLATFAWDAGDEAGRRLAAVQLVRLRAASQGQVAEAFEVNPATIWRWGGRAGPGPPRAEGRVEADARAGSPDRRAGCRREDAVADRGGDRGVDVHRPHCAGPGPA